MEYLWSHTDPSPFGVYQLFFVSLALRLATLATGRHHSSRKIPLKLRVAEAAPPARQTMHLNYVMQQSRQLE
jgi:hypothetical protein